jgi:hypothetical protein
MTKEAYKTVAFGLELKLVHTIHVIKQRILEIMLKASAYGLKIFKVLPNLIEWSKKKEKSYSELDEMYSALTGQFRRYMGHVTKNIGGIYDTPKTYDMEGNQFVIVPKTIQKKLHS